MTDTKTQTTLVLGGTGKTGRRVAQRLTIVRAAWFSQNFSEDYLLEPVLAGEVALPAGDTPEPFVDADDIADGVRRALGREPRNFAVYARDAADSGVWDVPAANGADQ